MVRLVGTLGWVGRKVRERLKELEGRDARAEETKKGGHHGVSRLLHC